MKYISELSGILSQRLNWHQSRIDCFAQMLLVLFTVRSINLSEIVVAMDGNKARIESRYKGINRFFHYLNLIISGLLVGFIRYFLIQIRRFTSQ